jgi:hypothetical protein
MQTLAQQNNVTEFPYVIKDANGNITYYETLNGYWIKAEYDQQGEVTSFEDSNSYWNKRKYDSQGNQIYYEDSSGYIRDNRPKKFNRTKVQVTI